MDRRSDTLCADGVATRLVMYGMPGLRSWVGIEVGCTEGCREGWPVGRSLEGSRVGPLRLAVGRDVGSPWGCVDG
jgi:hypothetical protein